MTSEESAESPTDGPERADSSSDGAAQARSVWEQLQDQLDVVTSRLDRLAAELADETSETRTKLETQLRRVRVRADETVAQMRDRIQNLSSSDDAPSEEAGSGEGDGADMSGVEAQALVEDLNSAVDTLEADIGASNQQEPDGYRAVVDRQLRAWRSRAEQLRAQSGFGSGEGGVDLDEAGRKINEVRSSVLAKLSKVAADAQEAAGGFAGTARDVIDEVRDEVEEALSDIRENVEKVADSVAKRTNRSQRAAADGAESDADASAADAAADVADAVVDVAADADAQGDQEEDSPPSS